MSPFRKFLSDLPEHSRHRLPQNLPVSRFRPFMVELFVSARFFRGTRKCLFRKRLSPSRLLPTPARVERTFRSEPHGRIWKHFASAPSLNMTTLIGNNIKDFPHRPRSGENVALSDRTLRLLVSHTRAEGLLERASVELGEHLSMQPSSTARATMLAG